MKWKWRDGGGGQTRRIEISLREVGQLFNTVDPSPFHEKDLDADAEEFIVSWAREFATHERLMLVVHLNEPPSEEHAQPAVEKAVQHYFAYRAKLNRLDFRRLMKDGLKSLAIGLGFLATCLIGSQMLAGLSTNPLTNVLRESLTIGGWVAMWRPMEIYLYSWWPVQRLGRVYRKMSRMKVELRVRKAPAEKTAAGSP